MTSSEAQPTQDYVTRAQEATDEQKRSTLLQELGSLSETIAPDEVKRLLDAADELIVETITASNIKRVLAQFEVKIKKNQEMRIKHKDHPEKFLKSEVDLDEEIKKIKQLAASPELIPQFIALGGLASLVAQLTHANVDIACEAVGVFDEMTDPDVIAEVEDSDEFVETLVKLGVPLLTVDVLYKIKEDESEEDAENATKALHVIENLSELDVSTADTFGRSTKCVAWLLRRIRQGTTVDFNRVYASEILNILLQNSESARVAIGKKDGLDGIDKLLRTIATHRKRDPDSAEEEELMWNLFDCLSLLLLVPQNQITFGSAQGVELMIRMLRERKRAYRAALRLTSFALQGCPTNCQLFVEKLGLKSLFGIFMRRSVGVKKKSEEKEDDEHMTSIIFSLCKHCNGMPVARVLNKFSENHFEKLQRLLELHEKYYDMSKLHEEDVVRRRETGELDRELDLDIDEQRYLDRCESGLSILHNVDNILIHLCNMGNALVAQRVHMLLDIKGIPIQQIQQVVSEYISRLAEGATEARKTTEDCLMKFLRGEDSSQT